MTTNFSFRAQPVLAWSALGVAFAVSGTVLCAASHPFQGKDPAAGLEGRDVRSTNIRNDPTVIEAAFRSESYAPASVARLHLFRSVSGVRLQLFRVGPERIRTRANDVMNGVAVSPVRQLGSRHAGQTLFVRIGAWPSGLYFARLAAAGGRVGFAPFVVRPRRLGGNRVAVVLPTLTWQAYNMRDDDGDGDGDTWYSDGGRTRSVRLGRPFLDRGVPFRFRLYDLPFLRWLDRSGREVDVLSDADLHRATGRALSRAYRLIVFPGHHEYVTRREFDAVTRYRNLGGNLMFLSANNFFWKVDRHGRSIERIAKWRELGRPEAALIGVQYIGNDEGERRGPWVVRRNPVARRLFAGTGVGPGRPFSSGGIEIDATSTSSPRSTVVLGEIRDLYGPGMTGQMSYYETKSGAKVFAAGAFTLAGAVFQPPVTQLMENLWQRLAAGEGEGRTNRASTSRSVSARTG